jgi:hypothetical protein
MSRQHLAARGLLEIHDVERLFGIGNHFGDLRRSLRECADSSERRDVRASGKKPKERAAMMDA